MTKILHIESSAQIKSSSISRRFSADVVRRLRDLMDSEVVSRDLASSPLPHINDAFVEAMFLAPEDRSEQHVSALALSEVLIQELEGADAVVIGCPMYNYSIPSALKAWLDHIVRARRTFIHTPTGPKGLLRDRPVYIVTSSGGVYSEGAGVMVDFLSPYLRAVLGKIGLHNLKFVPIEGIALGDVAVQGALAKAATTIKTLGIAAPSRRPALAT